MDLLPRTSGSAAENMARDLLLLEAHPGSQVPRLRTYGWSEPAHTFGISQRWAEWRPQVPAGSVLLRRPTGGGLVSHLADWTFALALPASHPVFQLEAIRSYAVVLGALGRALARQGLDLTQVPLPPGDRAFAAPSVCGNRPEPHDLVRGADGRKVAGAAQKRTREGLLLQGYVDRSSLPGCDWDALRWAFAVELGAALGSEPSEAPSPDYGRALEQAMLDRFASREWNERV
jgi:lipoyl(octanoyl) transferase